uniref:Chemokine (C-X-C motif) receptor 3, tandem duplicate 3 n=1 Tax=Neogobius melanostomus TaxID=47308 RepID=A0A8C6TG93_9GOBI
MDLEVELGGIFLYNNTFDYDSDYTYEDELEPRGAAVVLIPVLFSIVLAVGVPANVLVMVFLALKRQCWSTSDIFILHLGLSDILLLITLPFWAAQVAQPLGWCCGLFWCRINGALFNISFYSGLLLLAFVAAERFLSVIHSVQLFTQKTPRLAHIICMLIWLTSILLSIPDWVSLIYSEEPNLGGEKVCSCFANSYRSKWHVPSRAIHHVTYLLPVIALIVFFYYILMRLQESTKCRSIMLLLTLVLVYLLCWTPYNITLIVDTWKGRSKAHVPERTTLLATLALACVHACLRPLVYFALCEKFRGKSLAIVRCQKEEFKGDLWELGIGTENMPEQSSDPEMKQMNNSGEQQLQSGHC